MMRPQFDLGSSVLIPQSRKTFSAPHSCPRVERMFDEWSRAQQMCHEFAWGRVEGRVPGQRGGLRGPAKLPGFARRFGAYPWQAEHERSS